MHSSHQEENQGTLRGGYMSGKCDDCGEVKVNLWTVESEPQKRYCNSCKYDHATPDELSRWDYQNNVRWSDYYDLD
jgi:hypothetical protein